MRFGVVGPQGRRSGEQLTRPVSLAKLRARHRQKMCGVKMFWREPENLMIDTGRLFRMTAVMKGHGLTQEVCKTVPSAKVGFEPGLASKPLRQNEQGGVMFHARRVGNADITEAVPQFVDNLLPAGIEDVVGDGHLPAAQKVHHDRLPAVRKTG